MPAGRPTNYTPEIALEICTRLASGESLTAICKKKGMPNITVVYDWMFRDEEFAKMYARAREEQAETFADKINTISAKALKIADEGDPKSAGARVQAVKLQVETMKWTAAKLKPRKFGEKLDLTSDGKQIKGNTIVLKDFSENGTDGQ